MLLVWYFVDHTQYAGIQNSSIHGTTSVLGPTRMDQSFVVLPEQINQLANLPPRPRGGGVVQPETSQGGKMMEESFVVLPPTAASVYKTDSVSDLSGTHLPTAEGGKTINPTQHNASGFSSTIIVLQRAFDIATSQTQVEQPLCLECMRVL
ncbi:beclin-1-like protein [Impatiens glandulifera]|uniref:beclin-1-like protein n=1 Tax=Impatiens glandulifera TaxID=253017 RepID=UPI001FB0EE39|nr:beclin-1-like protein [Impatiens glandulifera]